MPIKWDDPTLQPDLVEDCARYGSATPGCCSRKRRMKEGGYAYP